MNASNLKNPEQYDEFVLALQKILIRFAIKMDSCLVAEEDGHIFNFVEESERNLEDSAEYDWYLMMLSVTPDYQR